MALTAEDKTELQQMIATALTAAAQPPAGAPVTPAPTDATQAPAAPLPQGFDVATFAQQLGAVLDEKLKPLTETAQASNQVTTSIWEDNIKQLETQNPTMHAYLQGNDEWGKPRIQTLEAEPDYAKRMQSLRSLASQVSQAQAAGAHSASAPVIPKKVQDAADAHNKKVKDLDAELAKGEMDMNDYADQAFNLMAEEGLFA